MRLNQGAYVFLRLLQSLFNQCAVTWFSYTMTDSFGLKKSSALAVRVKLNNNTTRINTIIKIFLSCFNNI